MIIVMTADSRIHNNNDDDDVLCLCACLASTTNQRFLQLRVCGAVVVATSLFRAAHHSVCVCVVVLRRLGKTPRPHPFLHVPPRRRPDHHLSLLRWTVYVL